MKGRNPNQRNEENRAQLILIGGLVIAVAVVAIALVIGGGLFSQSTNDDGGLSSFTSQTTEQVRVAEQVGQTNLNYSNVNSTLLEGAYPDELCGELVSSTEVRQLVSAQLGQGGSVVDIEVISQDCGNNTLEGASWVVGQTNPNYNLPSVNATDVDENERPPADVVFAIDTSGSMNSSTRVTKPAGYKTPVTGLFPSEDLTSTYRSDTGVTIPDEWIQIDNLGSWSGNITDPSQSVGDMVLDCSGFGACDTAEVTGFAGTGFFGTPFWNVEYEGGGTDTVAESNIDEMRYRLNAPERMWFTQKGLKNAVDDLNATVPDRAGLIGYDTSQSEEASVQGIDDPSHRDELKEDTDGFSPGGGTDIAEAIQESKDIVERDYVSSSDATKNIVILSDGEHNPTNGGYSPCGPANAYDCSIAGNQDEYEDYYIHAVILGEDAANNTDAVSDMAKITNDPDPDLDKSSVSESDLPARDDPRNEGTLIVSDDPSDAEGIFEDIVDDIGDISVETEGSSTGEVQEIHDMRMNVTEFRGNGTYRMRYENNSKVLWKMVVDNKFAPGPYSPHGYEVRFRSQTDGSLNETLTVDDSEGNLSDSDDYVWLDLTGRSDSKPRLEVGGLSTTETEAQLGGTSPDAYITDAWDEVRDGVNAGGVNIILNHIGPNGPNDSPFRRGEVNGTFAIEFEPKNGNFTRMEQLSGGNFTDDCNAANATDLPTRCGLNDNERGAVSTTQINEIELSVKVESPEGISERRITIPPGGEEFDFDIFDQETE